MKVLYIDCETTGLDTQSHQILEFAAVLDDLVSPVDSLPSFHRLVKHKELRGDPTALSLNKGLIDRIEDAADADTVTETGLLSDFHSWLLSFGEEFTVGGKNIGRFDLEFLCSLPGVTRDGGRVVIHPDDGGIGSKPVVFLPRHVDPAVLFWNPKTDRKLPSLDECCRRAGIPPRTSASHSAVQDALLVAELVRWAKAS